MFKVALLETKDRQVVSTNHEGAPMIDVTLKGIRCRAATEILDIEGTIGASTEGTIVYELEGEGGQLVNVHWDDGTQSLVSSEEIVITDAVTWQ
jgi:hypothetical protein